MKSAPPERVFLGLGSNVGNRLMHLSSAVRAVEDLPGTMLARCSNVYETSPWGVTGQASYLNCAIEIATELDPSALLAELKRIETDLGRDAGPRYAPRVIDIDILLFGSRVLETDRLRIPHLMLPERRFVLVPLSDIAGDVRHPVIGEAIRDLLMHCSDIGSVVDTGERICP
jgi:2-amino-4-hydroxy-6-hydroxymethyldihydropteridine diphosphokinase